MDTEAERIYHHQLRLTEELRKEIFDLAQRDGRTMKAEMMVLLREAIEARRKKLARQQGA